MVPRVKSVNTANLLNTIVLPRGSRWAGEGPPQGVRTLKNHLKRIGDLSLASLNTNHTILTYGLLVFRLGLIVGVVNVVYGLAALPVWRLAGACQGKQGNEHCDEEGTLIGTHPKLR